jgi:YfiH family protein
MFLTKNKNIPLLHFENLSKFNEIKHYITTKDGGVSTEHLASLNLGYTVNDLPENVEENRILLVEELSILKNQLLFAKQSSESKVVIVNELHFPKFIGDIHLDLISVDAMITDRKGIFLSILTADCVPILIFDKVKKVIAVSHAGWKGTVLKITQKTAILMHEKFNCNYDNLIVGIGPSISPAVYEVGFDVINEFKQAFTNYNEILTPINEQKALLNLWKANEIQLLELGVKKENIEISEICTFSNPDIFFSARKTKGKTGRFASGIMLNV